MKNKLITALILAAGCSTAQAGETELAILDPGLDVFTECDYHPTAHLFPGGLSVTGSLFILAGNVPGLGIALIATAVTGWFGVPAIEDSNFLMPKCDNEKW